MRIYVCHQFGGKKENVLDVENKLKELYMTPEINALLYKRVTFYSPLHATGFLYDVVKDWHDGMRMCLEELRTSDAMLTFGEDSMSAGCMLEKELCAKLDIPLIEYDVLKQRTESALNTIDDYWDKLYPDFEIVI